jgi:hypothetical protein
MRLRILYHIGHSERASSNHINDSLVVRNEHDKPLVASKSLKMFSPLVGVGLGLTGTTSRFSGISWSEDDATLAMCYIDRLERVELSVYALLSQN